MTGLGLESALRLPGEVPITGFDLVSETTVDGSLLLAAAQVAVVRLA